MTVLLATSRDWPDLFADDHLLRDALRARGVDARAAIWDAEDVAWGDAGLVVLRSIWDYTTRREEFLAWLKRVNAQGPVHNPYRVVEWNSHKRYLRDLEAAGIPIIPTEWLGAGQTVDAHTIMEAREWSDVVVKPSVSAGARRTVRGDAATVQAHIDALLPENDLMMQPYITETEAAGEHSLIHIGGMLSHVVRKDPALTGGRYSSSSVVTVEPDPAEVELAQQVLEQIGPLLYARVDCVVVDGRACVMEIELIEPQLFFGHAPAAADRMAASIIQEL